MPRRSPRHRFTYVRPLAHRSRAEISGSGQSTRQLGHRALVPPPKLAQVAWRVSHDTVSSFGGFEDRDLAGFVGGSGRASRRYGMMPCAMADEPGRIYACGGGRSISRSAYFKHPAHRWRSVVALSLLACTVGGWFSVDPCSQRACRTSRGSREAGQPSAPNFS